MHYFIANIIDEDLIYLSSLEIAAMYIAAVIHDYQHP